VERREQTTRKVEGIIEDEREKQVCVDDRALLAVLWIIWQNK
jgi:hypothetical protein